MKKNSKNSNLTLNKSTLKSFEAKQITGGFSPTVTIGVVIIIVLSAAKCSKDCC